MMVIDIYEKWIIAPVYTNVVYFSYLRSINVNVKGIILSNTIQNYCVFEGSVIISYSLSKTSAAYRILEGVLVSIIFDSLSLVYIKLYINNL